MFGLISFQPTTIARLQEYSFKVSYLALFLWFFSTDIIVEYNQVIYFEPYFIRPILLTIDLVQLLITLAYFISYYKCKFELAKFRSKKHEEALAEEEKRLRAQSGMSLDDPDEYEKYRRNTSPSSKLVTFLAQIVTSSQLYIIVKFDEKFKYVLLYLITSLFGTFYSQSAFLIYIVYFFLQNETLSNVFNAIFYNLNQLFSVGVLGVVFVYIFSLICYETYALDLMSEKDSEGSCDSIVSCIMDLYVSGTIGGSVQ